MSAKATFSMGLKVETFPTQHNGSVFPSLSVTLCLPDSHPGTGLQEPSAWVIFVNVTLWPWLTGADHSGPSAWGCDAPDVSCTVCTVAGVSLAGVQKGGSSYPARTSYFHDLRIDSPSSERGLDKKAPLLGKLQSG